MSGFDFDELNTQFPGTRSTTPTEWVSERFRAGDFDVTFRSTDGCLFRIHRKNLEANCGGFPPPGFETRGEVVRLTEESSTLDLLFQFIYPARHPDLESTPFEALSLLAEAAEKYEVFSAINICKIRMRNILPAHAKEILVYAAKHDYPDILGDAAPLLLSNPISQIVTTLPIHLVVPWILYSENMATILRDAITYPDTMSWNMTNEQSTGSFYGPGGVYFSQTSKTCYHCSFNADVMVRQVIGRLKDAGCLKDLDIVFSQGLGVCSHVEPNVLLWRSFIEGRIQQTKPFTNYL